MPPLSEILSRKVRSVGLGRARHRLALALFLLFLAALSLCALPAALAEAPPVGRLLMLDPQAAVVEEPGAILALSLESGTVSVVGYPSGFRRPTCLKRGERSRFYFGDGNRLLRFDCDGPMDQSLDEFRYVYLVSVVDIERTDDGRLYVLDAIADPLGEGYRGAIFRFDPPGGEWELIISSELFCWPVGIEIEPDGDLLMLDRTGLLEPGGEHKGAFYRVDPDARSLEVVCGLDYMDGPADFALIGDSLVAVVDETGQNPDTPEATGLVWILDRASWSPVSYFGSEAFVSPRHVEAMPDGSIAVLDPDSNPGAFQEAKGAVFHFDPATGGMLDVLFSEIFRRPAAIALMDGADLSSSDFSLTDLNWPRVRPGDMMRLETTLRSDGLAPCGELSVRIAGDGIDLLGSTCEASKGEFVFDPDENELVWTGELGVPDSLLLTLDLRVPFYADSGEAFSVDIEAGNEVVVISKHFDGVVERLSSEGDMVFLDAGTIWPNPRLFTLDEDGMPVTLALLNESGEPYELGTPLDLTFLPDGALCLLERASGTGNLRLLRIDPRTGVSIVLHEGDPLMSASALGLSSDGLLLIADVRTSPPIDTPGLIFKFDPDHPEMPPWQLTEENPAMLEPVGLCTDREGHFLVADYEANVAGSQTGALFEIDSDGTFVDTIAWSGLSDPISAVVGSDGAIYLADLRRGGQPEGGAIYRLERRESGVSISVLVAPGNEWLVEPYSIVYESPTSFLVVDRESNPYGLVGNHGAILRLEKQGASWHLGIVCAVYDVRDPLRAAIYRYPDLEIQDLAIQDLSGGDLVPGDTVALVLSLTNAAPNPLLGAMVSFMLDGPLQKLSAEASGGRLDFDAGPGVITWGGDLLFLTPVQVRIEALVDSLACFGEVVSFSIDAVAPGAPPTVTVTDTVWAPPVGGETLVLDSEAEGEWGRGAVFEMDWSQERLQPLAGVGLFERPVDFLAVTPDSFLILDADADPLQLGGDTGALLGWRLAADTFSVVCAGAALVNPVRAVWGPDGAVFILDPAACRSDSAAGGAIFRVKPGAGTEPETLLVLPEARSLSDLCFDGFSTLWVSDADGDPLGLGGEDTGAIYAIDLPSASVRDTVAGDSLVDPTGLLWAEGEGLYFTDPGWFEEGKTGLRRYLPDTGSFEYLGGSVYLVRPSRLARTDNGDLLILDPEGIIPGYPDAVGGLFIYDEYAGRVATLAGHGSLRAPSGLICLPRADGRLVDFTVQSDSAGAWAAPGDTLRCEVHLYNASVVPERSMEVKVHFDRNLLLASAPELPAGWDWEEVGEGFVCRGPLGGFDSVAVSYGAIVGTGYPDGYWAVQRVKATGSRRVSAEESTFYISNPLAPGEVLIVDSRANPLSIPHLTGCIFRVVGPTRDLVPVLAGSLLVTPVSAARVPGENSRFVIADADCAPSGTGTGGALLFGNTITGQLEVACWDSTFLEPSDVEFVDTTTCILLDRGADPYDLTPDLFGPGALYLCDIETGEVTVAFSDTVLGYPVDLAVDQETGVIYLVDQMAGGTGGVFAIDLDAGSCEPVLVGEPFLSPRCGLLWQERRMLIADAGYDEVRLFSLLLDTGVAEIYGTCTGAVMPEAIERDPLKRPLLLDSQANPYDLTGPTGTIFRIAEGGLQYPIYKTGLPLRAPVDLLAGTDTTPVLLLWFSGSVVPEGILLRWEVASTLQGALFYLYRKDLSDSGGSLEALNPWDPLEGEGEIEYLDASAANGHSYEYLLTALLPDGATVDLGSVRVSASAPRFAFYPVFPNPVSAGILGGGLPLRFEIPARVRVHLSVFDVAGRLVVRLEDRLRDPGLQTLYWYGFDAGGRPVPSGHYWLRLQAGPRKAVRHLVVVR